MHEGEELLRGMSMEVQRADDRNHELLRRCEELEAAK